MPAIITPPEIDRRPRPRRPEENDGGHGRRPPNGRDLKRTGGGGDNDNWSDRPSGRRGPGERLSTYRLGLFFALGAVFMFFIGIVSVFFVSQTIGHFDAYNRYINAWLPTTIPPILWLNTLVLLLSSITIEISRRALPWLLATLTLGGLFLTGQMLAWHQLGLERVFFKSNPSSHSFYIIT